jgi:hypothetical protein
VLEGDLCALDDDDDARYVLTRDAELYRCDSEATRAVALPLQHEAFMTTTGERRPLVDAKVTAWGLVFATTGGIIVCPSNEDPIFYEAPNADTSARISRLGAETDAPLLVTIGAHLWVWDGGVPTVVDTRTW